MENKIKKFCVDFVGNATFNGIKEITPSLFSMNPSSVMLVALMESFAETVLEAYIISLAESMANQENLADQLFMGVK